MGYLFRTKGGTYLVLAPVISGMKVCFLAVMFGFDLLPLAYSVIYSINNIFFINMVSYRIDPLDS